MHPFRKVCILFAFESFRTTGGKGQTHEQKNRAKGCILFGKYAYFSELLVQKYPAKVCILSEKYASFPKRIDPFGKGCIFFRKVCILSEKDACFCTILLLVCLTLSAHRERLKREKDAHFPKRMHPFTRSFYSSS